MVSLGKIEEIPLDDLGVDECNIRKGIWDGDQELVDSIKTKGVLEPLIVRPLTSISSAKYGIVCGSRRYNAAVEAGLISVPCIIRELDTIDAMSLSMIENRQRTPTPLWMDIEYVGIMHDLLLKSKHPGEAMDYIVEQTGLNSNTVSKYVRIHHLPEEIKGLLRESNERTQRQAEYLKLFLARKLERPLHVTHAYHISFLNGEKFPLNRMMQISLFIIQQKLPADITKELVERLNMYPAMTPQEVYDNLLKREYTTVTRVINFSQELWASFADACLRRQMYYQDLLIDIVTEWLTKEGFKQEQLD